MIILTQVNVISVSRGFVAGVSKAVTRALRSIGFEREIEALERL